MGQTTKLYGLEHTAYVCTTFRQRFARPNCISHLRQQELLGSRIPWPFKRYLVRLFRIFVLLGSVCISIVSDCHCGVLHPPESLVVGCALSAVAECVKNVTPSSLAAARSPLNRCSTQVVSCTACNEYMSRGLRGLTSKRFTGSAYLYLRDVYMLRRP